MLVNTIVQSCKNEKYDDIDVHLLNTAPRLLSRIGVRYYFLCSLICFGRNGSSAELPSRTQQ